LPPEAEICGCNGVCKGKIVTAIDGGATYAGRGARRHQGQRLLRHLHRAGGKVMALTLGDSFTANANPPMCKCTDHTHEDVRRLIKSMG
jgi:nitrite reductase (NADH) large subunit